MHDFMENKLDKGDYVVFAATANGNRMTLKFGKVIGAVGDKIKVISYIRRTRFTDFSDSIFPVTVGNEKMFKQETLPSYIKGKLDEAYNISKGKD